MLASSSIPTITRVVSILLTLACLFAPALSAAQGYRLQPEPGWVQPASLPTAANASGSERNDVSYLLVDRQWLADDTTQQQYGHFATKALNTSGVSSIAQVTVDFDPAYETVTLHKLQIHRDGRILDRLTRSRIDVLQREQELDYQIYDGTHTLNIFIEDVRLGDTVEYSYTVSGSNPVLDGHFSAAMQLQWSAPVSLGSYRVVWRKPRPLNVVAQNTTDSFQQQNVSNGTVFTWRRASVPALVEDQHTPGWYQPYPVFRVSDMVSWDEVVAWGEPLYATGRATSAQNAVIRDILRKTEHPDERALAALRFVQDDIRYLGIEMGARSHRPSTPDQVLRQRFGDCKDKTRLLVSLLHGLGVQASPVLVHTNAGRALNGVPPSPTAFDHAIVMARIYGKTYWLDPTLSHQAGTLDTLFQPNYHQALVLDSREHGLRNMSEDLVGRHHMQVEEALDLSQGPTGPASYTVTTHHEGGYADDFRRQLASNSHADLQRSYLNFTARYYPGVQATGDVKVERDDTANRVTVKEHYRIPSAWNPSDDNVHVLAQHIPYLVDNQVKDISAPVRTMPYGVAHPVSYRQITRVKVPPDSAFEPEFQTVDDPAFRFTKTVSFRDDLLTLDYQFTSLKPAIQAADIPGYREHLRQARALAYYSIQMVDPAINFADVTVAPSDINWTAALTLITSVIALGALMVVAYRYDPRPRAPQPDDSRYQGLGGWLVLVGIGLLISPIRLLFNSREQWYVLSERKWAYVSQTFGPGATYIELSALIATLGLILLCILATVLFFKQRRSFRPAFIILSVLGVVTPAIFLLLWHRTGAPELAATNKDIALLIGEVIRVSIWTAYMLRSKRVRATFVNTYRNPAPSPSGTAALPSGEAVTVPAPRG